MQPVPSPTPAPAARRTGLVVAGVIVMLLSLGGGGFLANVNNTDREFDEKHLAELKADLKKAGAAATEKLESDIASTKRDLESVTTQLYAALGGMLVGVVVGGVLLALGLRRRAV